MFQQVNNSFLCTQLLTDAVHCLTDAHHALMNLPELLADEHHDDDCSEHWQCADGVADAEAHQIHDDCHRLHGC